MTEKLSDGTERVLRGETDWNRVAMMDDDEVQRAAEGDPDAQPLTDESLARARRVPKEIDIRGIRLARKMSRAAFAQRYGFELNVLHDWENGSRPLDRYARILLAVIEKEPEAVDRALAV